MGRRAICDRELAFLFQWFELEGLRQGVTGELHVVQEFVLSVVGDDEIEAFDVQTYDRVAVIVDGHRSFRFTEGDLFGFVKASG